MAKRMPVEEMARMIGIDAQNLQFFLKLYAIEMEAGATLEQAIRNVGDFLQQWADEAAKPRHEQSEKYIRWKEALASEVWHSIRAKDHAERAEQARKTVVR